MTSSLYLVGNREIRSLLGDISRQRVYQLTIRPDFPPPVASLSQGKVWLGEDVESWMERKRRPRPQQQPTPPEPAPTDQPEIPTARREPITWLSASPHPRPPALNAGRAYERSATIPCCLHGTDS